MPPVLQDCDLSAMIQGAFKFECQLSHHITSHHVTSHHITSHHITSHHIAADHVVFITFQILRGLKYIHSAGLCVFFPPFPSKQPLGVLHRDLKPQNILVNSSLDVRMMMAQYRRTDDAIGADLRPWPGTRQVAWRRGCHWIRHNTLVSRPRGAARSSFSAPLFTVPGRSC